MNFNFDKLAEYIKLGAGFVAALLINFFGSSRKYIYLLLVLMAFDTVLGWIAAKKRKEWRSDRAKWGFAGKIITLMLICILFLVDKTFELEILQYIGIFYYAVVEIASIFENLSLIENIVLPEGLVDLLNKLKKNAGKTVLEAIRKLLKDEAGIDIKNEKDQENKEEK